MIKITYEQPTANIILLKGCKLLDQKRDKLTTFATSTQYSIGSPRRAIRQGSGIKGKNKIISVHT
jgi:hypothetical protein